MSKTLKKERFYPVRPDVVWEAITNPAALAEWLMPNSFRAEVGASFEFRTDPTAICGSGLTRCKVIELVPCKRMVWTWHRDADVKSSTPPMTITWTLAEEHGGTRLVLEQAGLEHQSWLIRILMSIGWGMMLRRSLSKVIANISVADGVARFASGAIPLSKRYYTCKSVPKSYLHAADGQPV